MPSFSQFPTLNKIVSKVDPQLAASLQQGFRQWHAQLASIFTELVDSSGQIVAAQTANNALHLGGKVEGQLSVLAAASAATATLLAGRAESELDVNTALIANNALFLNGHPQTYYTNVENLATGTMPTARLGTGTANSTTYLGGDQTWKSITTLIVPDANTTSAGLVNVGTQSFAGAKTFTANLAVSTGNVTVSNGSLFVANGSIFANGSIRANGAGATVFSEDRSDPTKSMAMYRAGVSCVLWASDYGNVLTYHANNANIYGANNIGAANGYYGYGRSVREGEWTSYTTSWGGTVGDGSKTAFYTLIGKTCHFLVHIGFGSTTSGPGGLWTVTVPFAAQHAVRFPVATVYCGNAGVQDYTGVAFIESDQSTVYAQIAGVFVTNSTPFTFGVGDTFVMSGSYPIA